MRKVSAVVTESVHKRLAKHSRILSAIALIILLLLIALNLHQPVFAPNHPISPITAELASSYVTLEIVDTPDKRSQGLSGRAVLPDYHGMIFMFPELDAGLAVGEQACFWMKDMNFALDILWFDQNNLLIYQKENASPSSYPEKFCPPRPVKYVLEFTAGTSGKLGLKLGDELILLENQ